jgi:hypothetical protein
MAKAIHRRAFVAGTGGGLAGGTVPAAPAAAADPIFSLIEKHRALLAAWRAERDARRALEDELVPARASYGMDGPGWERCLRDHPDLARTVQADADAMKAETEAFNDLLRQVPSTTPDGFLALARYACDLTFEEDGPALEGALPAYRVLAALAGRAVFGAELESE